MLEQAVEVDEIVGGLGKYLSQKDIATGAGVSERAVRAWVNAKTAVRPANYQGLTKVREIVLVLRDSLTERGVRQWMSSPNRPLGGRVPLEALREGDFDAVLRSARSFVDGAYV